MTNSTFSTSIQEPPGPSAKLVLPTQTPNTNPTVFNDGMIIRQRVFIEEQKCSADAEIDSDDSRSWHWVMYHTSTGTTSNGRPVGVIRLVPPPQVPHCEVVGTAKEAENDHSPTEPCIKLTRVAIMPEYRGLGLGRRLVETALGWAAVHGVEIKAAIEDRGAVGEWRGLVLVHAQVDVERMYIGLGFETDEGLGRWDEEGIEHVGMFRRIALQ
jgi:predicted GNAT family N-acyltransferase